MLRGSLLTLQTEGVSAYRCMGVSMGKTFWDHIKLAVGLLREGLNMDKERNGGALGNKCGKTEGKRIKRAGCITKLLVSLCA